MGDISPHADRCNHLRRRCRDVDDRHRGVKVIGDVGASAGCIDRHRRRILTHSDVIEFFTQLEINHCDDVIKLTGHKG